MVTRCMKWAGVLFLVAAVPLPAGEKRAVEAPRRLGTARFTNLGRLCHEPWGLGEEHMRRILTDHSVFPRAVCRHAGPDTAEYDRTITQGSHFVNLTHNRGHTRQWVPWKKFCCEVPEVVTQYPPRGR